MDQHKGNDERRPTIAERRSVRRAIARGRLVTAVHLRPYAVQRIRYATNKFEDIQRRLEGSRRRRRLLLALLSALGLAVLLSGLSPHNTVRIVIGSCCVALGIAFLLLQPLADREVKRLLEDAARAKRIQEENNK